MKWLNYYANKKNITLELIEKSENVNYYPFLKVVENNIIEMVKLLIGYVHKNNIILELNEINGVLLLWKLLYFYWLFIITILK